MLKNTRLSALPLVLALVATPSLAQLKQGEKPTAEQVATGEAPATPIDETEKALRSLRDQAASVKWTRAAAGELLSYVDRVHEEGLDPAYYDAERLRSALAGKDEAALSFAATDTFLRLSSDLALGHVRGDARIQWHMLDPDLNGNEQYSLMQRAVQNNSVHDTLNSLLPTHPQYTELKGVLANSKDPSHREKARANLERWRWMPRDLGQRYVIVNVPAYSVAIVENGGVVARHRAVVGAPKTATPQLSAVATGVILNPWWEIPKSIEPEVRGKKGYVTVKSGDGVRYRQPPGPSNALGRMKVVMPNNYAIYLHDTPSKAAFKRDARALSHGCIRTQDPLAFAAMLLNNPEWDKAKIDAAIAAGKTVQANASAPTPVYVAYFTAAAAKDNGGIIAYNDIYGRDKTIMAAFAKSSNTALASR
ncbi:MAG TPA: L,D-transpeptidase family protein [Allosphingosinicella sp.]|nr:L,D-transpeptidase family protein [Allosphingosinicella sp.]